VPVAPNQFSVAQAFTPGKEGGVSFKSPINGALIAPPVSHPGVNALGYRNVTMKLDHYLLFIVLAVSLKLKPRE
jgi:hypothetical protein